MCTAKLEAIILLLMLMLLIPILTVSLIKFDKKKAGRQLLLCRVGILNAPLLSVCKQIKTTPVLLQKKVDSLLTAFSLEIVFGANCRAGVQLILVQGSSPPGIVLLWDPRGAGQGVCGPRGASFTNTAAAENLNCKGGKNRVAWMADILG